MDKCNEVRCNNIAEYAWQPFGPDDSSIGTMTSLGSHYRGFPVIKVCRDCHDYIVNQSSPSTPPVLHFTYKGKSLWWDTNKRTFEESPF